MLGVFYGSKFYWKHLYTLREQTLLRYFEFFYKFWGFVSVFERKRTLFGGDYGVEVSPEVARLWSIWRSKQSWEEEVV